MILAENNYSPPFPFRKAHDCTLENENTYREDRIDKATKKRYILIESWC